MVKSLFSIFTPLHKQVSLKCLLTLQNKVPLFVTNLPSPFRRISLKIIDKILPLQPRQQAIQVDHGSRKSPAIIATTYQAYKAGVAQIGREAIGVQ